MPKPLTPQQFVELAEKVHGSLYDYQLVQYKNFKTKVTVICKEHGPFLVSPHLHTSNKTGCPRCAYGSRTTDTETFIQRCKEIFRDHPLDYSNVQYSGLRHPVTLTCELHGPFTKKRAHSLLSSKGCPVCAKRGNGHYRWTKWQLNNPDKMDIPCTIYVYSFKDVDTRQQFYKIGITTHSTKHRFRGYVQFNKISLFEKCTTIRTGIALENHLSKLLVGRQTKYKFTSRFNGRTECYDLTPDELSTVLDTLTAQLV
jgi:hypothetical protein